LEAQTKIAWESSPFPKQLGQGLQIFQVPFSMGTLVPNPLGKVTQWMNVVYGYFNLQLVIYIITMFFQLLIHCVNFSFNII
jgi:hypothetical protein